MDKDPQHSATELHIKNCLKGNWPDLNYVVSIKEYQIAILKNKSYQHRLKTVVLNEADVPCKNGGCILANYMWTFFHPSNHSKNVCVLVPVCWLSDSPISKKLMLLYFQLRWLKFHSFWKAANLTTFMTPGTWNMQPVATSSAAAWIPRRRPKMCARLRSLRQEMIPKWDLLICIAALVKHQKKIDHITNIRIILRSWYPLSPVD